MTIFNEKLFPIVVKNSSDKTHTVELFGASQYLNGLNWNAGGTLCLDDALTISSELDNLSYRDMLYHFIANPRKIVKTVARIIEGKDWKGIQLFQESVVRMIDANTKEVFIELKNFSTLNYDEIVTDDQYRVDVFTRLIFSIPANTAMRIEFYAEPFTTDTEQDQMQALTEIQQQANDIREGARMDFEIESCRQAYTCQVENIGDEIARVVLFSEEYANENIKIQSSIPGLTYKEMIRHIGNTKAVVGMTSIEVAPFTEHGENGHVKEDRGDYEAFFISLGMVVMTKGGDGSSVSIPICFELSPRQHQKNVCFNFNRFNFIGLTYIIFFLRPNRKLDISFHIKEDLYKFLR
jgi:hypothetical protein